MRWHTQRYALFVNLDNDRLTKLSLRLSVVGQVRAVPSLETRTPGASP